MDLMKLLWYNDCQFLKGRARDAYGDIMVQPDADRPANCYWHILKHLSKDNSWHLEHIELLLVITEK